MCPCYPGENPEAAAKTFIISYECADCKQFSVNTIVADNNHFFLHYKTGSSAFTYTTAHNKEKTGVRVWSSFDI